MKPKPPKPKRLHRATRSIIQLPASLKLELTFRGSSWTGHVEFNGARIPIVFDLMAVFGMFYKDKISRLLTLMESSK
jgi:hypothetical protein